MTRNFLRTLFVATAGTIAFGALLVQAQEPTRPVQERPAGTAADAEANRLLATWLVADGRLEIEVSQLAQQRAQRPDVKDFAQRMITDHRQLVEKLQPFASPVDIGRAHPDGGAAGADGDPREAAARAGDFDHVALVEELGKEYLQTARKVLGEKQGEELDRVFMHMAVAHHMKTLDTMKVFRKHASGELEGVIRQGMETVQQHLERAKSIAEEMSSASSGEGGR